MPTTTTPTRDDAQIRESIDAWAQALRAKDIRTLMKHYAPDMVTFDLMPLQLQGADAYRRNLVSGYGSCSRDTKLSGDARYPTEACSGLPPNMTMHLTALRAAGDRQR